MYKKIAVLLILLSVPLLLFAAFTTTVNIDPSKPEKHIDSDLFGLTGDFRVYQDTANDSTTHARYVS